MRSIVHIREGGTSTMNVVVLGLLLLLPASPHGAEFVLCLQDSGQVNVERFDEAQSEGFAVGDWEEIDVLGSSEEHSSTDCSDVPLRLTEANDPCATAILSFSTSPEGPSEYLSPASARPTPQALEVDEPNRPSPHRFRRSSAESGLDASLSSVVLLI